MLSDYKDKYLCWIPGWVLLRTPEGEAVWRWRELWPTPNWKPGMSRMTSRKDSKQKGREG
jgi:hypothetical protein